MARKIHSKLAKAVENVEGDTRAKRDLYVPTNDAIKHWFRFINREAFGSELYEFRDIEIRRRHGCWAECTGDTDRKTGEKYSSLCMNHNFKSEKHFIEVLAHEMVHHYQWIYYETMDHGQTFFEWKDELKKHNLNINIKA
jgi:AAA+ ATPase superfamily predicted ATPase